MSSIFNKTKKAAEVWRLSATENQKREYAKHADIQISIHNLSAEDSVLYDGVSGRGFRGFTRKGVDVKKRDEIRIGSDKYDVKAVQVFDYGAFPHQKLILEQIRET